MHRKDGIERDLWIGWVEPDCGEDWKCRVGSAARPVPLPAGRHYSAFCENLLALIPVLWRFALTEGMERTNNHAERLLRRGVPLRQHPFGSPCEVGCRFVERLLTVAQTCWLQGRSTLRYLYEALLDLVSGYRQGTACGCWNGAGYRPHRAGLPSPSFLRIDLRAEIDGTDAR